MTPDRFHALAVKPALSLLPPAMTSAEAEAMLIAMAWQESRLTHRRQIGGPARGYWQFELGGGVLGVLAHAQTRVLIRGVMAALDYAPDSTPYACHDAIGHNDVLAGAFARLLLWTVPAPLPRRAEPSIGWTQYREAWRPGKPHPESWADAWSVAWSTIDVHVEKE